VPTATATEVIRFLSGNPSPKKILDYHVSQSAQSRLQHLLNQAGMISESEQLELDELQSLEHTIIMLKARVANQLQKEA